MPSLEPDPSTLSRWLADASRWVIEHVSRLESANAAGPADPSVAAEVSRAIPEQPAGDLAELLPVLDRAVEASLRANGPGYMAYIPGGGLPSVAIADLLADVANRFTGIAGTAPALVRLEADVLRWLAREFGYPDAARGMLTSGGSLANFAGILAARHRHLGDSGDFREAVVYTSAQVHHSVMKGVRLAGIPERNVRAIAVDERYRMRMDALEAAVLADSSRQPFLVVATAGTTNTGAIDPLREIADFCAIHGLWLHVDGAYGGGFVLCPEGKRRLSGIERADSISFDPHKAMFLPYGTGCVLVREGRHLSAAHGGAADYLQDIATDDVPSPTSYGPELSRPFRGIRLWLPLMLHGAAAFREALSEKLALADAVADGLAALDLEILDRPQLTVVAFRLPRAPGEPPVDWDARNQAFLRDINRRGHAWLSSTRIDDRFVLRVCVVSFRTHRAHIDALLADVRDCLAPIPVPQETVAADPFPG